MTERRLKKQKILGFHDSESGAVSPVSAQNMWEEENMVQRIMARERRAGGWAGDPICQKTRDSTFSF